MVFLFERECFHLNWNVSTWMGMFPPEWECFHPDCQLMYVPLTLCKVLHTVSWVHLCVECITNTPLTFVYFRDSLVVNNSFSTLGRNSTIGRSFRGPNLNTSGTKTRLSFRVSLVYTWQKDMHSVFILTDFLTRYVYSFLVFPE